MKKMIAAVLAAAVCAFGALVLPASGVLAEEAQSAMEQGKALAFDRKKGNCLACHMIEGGESPGNIGPPLIAMKVRYPDKAKLRAQIWDATAINPESAMVPFGRNRILTEAEIDKLVEYIWTL